MKKLILFVLIIGAAFAGDWLYEDVKFASGDYQSFDTIESFYSLTYEVGRGKKLPQTLTITHKVVPDTSTENLGDSVDCVISLDYSNDKSIWYTYGAIDTIDLDSATVAAETVTIGTKSNYPILDYRYFRLKVTSNTVDTFTVQLQKSVEF